MRLTGGPQPAADSRVTTPTFLLLAVQDGGGRMNRLRVRSVRPSTERTGGGQLVLRTGHTGTMNEHFLEADITDDGRCSWIGYDDEPLVEWESLTAVADDYWATSGYRSSLVSWREDAIGPATSFVMNVMQVGHPRSVDLLQALVDAAASEEELDFVGAGPLKDLLSHHRHAAEFVDDVERRARQQSRFRTVVSGLWLSADVPGQVRERLAVYGARLLGHP